MSLPFRVIEEEIIISLALLYVKSGSFLSEGPCR
jgi:hypothetical protein